LEAVWGAVATQSKLLQSPYSVLQDSKATFEVALVDEVAFVAVASAVIEAASGDAVASATKVVVVLVVDKVATKADHRPLMPPADLGEEVGMVVVTRTEGMVVMVEVETETTAVEQEVTEIRSVDEIVGMIIETVTETGIEIETATATETEIGTATGTDSGEVEMEIDGTMTMVLASDTTRTTRRTTQESDGIDIHPSFPTLYYSTILCISGITCITCITVGWLAGGYFIMTVFPLPFWGTCDHLPFLFRCHGKDFFILPCYKWEFY